MRRERQRASITNPVIEVRAPASLEITANDLEARTSHLDHQREAHTKPVIEVRAPASLEITGGKRKPRSCLGGALAHPVFREQFEEEAFGFSAHDITVAQFATQIKLAALNAFDPDVRG